MECFVQHKSDAFALETLLDARNDWARSSCSCQVLHPPTGPVSPHQEGGLRSSSVLTWLFVWKLLNVFSVTTALRSLLRKLIQHVPWYFHKPSSPVSSHKYPEHWKWTILNRSWSSRLSQTLQNVRYSPLMCGHLWNDYFVRCTDRPVNDRWIFRMVSIDTNIADVIQKHHCISRKMKIQLTMSIPGDWSWMRSEIIHTWKYSSPPHDWFVFREKNWYLYTLYAYFLYR